MRKGGHELYLTHAANVIEEIFRFVAEVKSAQDLAFGRMCCVVQASEAPFGLGVWMDRGSFLRLLPIGRVDSLGPA